MCVHAQLGKAAEESVSSEDGDGRCAHISTEGSELSVDELTFEQIIDNEIGLVQKLHHPNIITIKEVRAPHCAGVGACVGGALQLKEKPPHTGYSWVGALGHRRRSA